MNKRIAAAILICTMCTSTFTINAAEVGGTVKIGDYSKSATKTQELIENRPNVQRMMENIDRGVVAVKTEDGVFISWRWLGTESLEVLYNIYRNGIKLNNQPLKSTNYTDLSPMNDAQYSVSAVINGIEGEKSEPVKVWADGYFDIPLQKPETSYSVDGNELNIPYRTSGDSSVADLDGDGEYEIIVKWDPKMMLDASKKGYAGIWSLSVDRH